ncbi:ion channel protein [Luteimicrobium subarcticum]|uniref:ion channel protein n=1 Tax=Luteimicrobium subarcticum TaxID=620910 RepID=UPI001FECB666|nr:ion channel protein [Luteimicrobium subarcticum]
MTAPDAPVNAITDDEFRVPVARLLAMTPVGIVVGAFCAVSLWALSALAGVLQRLVWDDLSQAVGLSADSSWWILLVLTVTGLLVGLVVRYAPGHAGPDPATTELVAAPEPPGTVPGLAVALVLMLAGGVSLGPENPIMAINAALVVAAGVKYLPRTAVPEWVGLSTSATIGAMFGTPVSAALLLTESADGDRRIPLWNRLYLPLVAAATGSFVMLRFTDLDLSIGLPAEDVGGVVDVLLAVAVAVVVAAVGVAASLVFDPLHRFVHRLRNPVVLLTVAGVVLGLLGVLGGPITLFKGLDELKELPGELPSTTAAGFVAMAGVKLVALLVASTAGFRGGRIFPAVFIGAALGFGVHALWTEVPLTLAVTAAVVGIVVAATRNGWVSLFLALAVVPQMNLLVPLLFATLAAWLVVANRPELRAEPIDEPDASGPHAA